MTTRKVTKNADIRLYANNDFLYCKELGKGFVKKDTSKLTITDYSFEAVVTLIENLTAAEINTADVDSVLFVDGIISVSEKVDEGFKVEVVNITDQTALNNAINAKRAKRKYFKVYELVDLEPKALTNSDQMIF